MKSILQNKRAVSLSGWSEAILLSLLAVLMIGIIVAGFNTLYDQDHDIGINTDTIQENFEDYQETLSREITEGEAEFTSDQGLTLKSSWGIIKSGLAIIWDFMTGGWIETIVNYMKLPSTVALIFRILYFLSLGYVVLKILFKIKP